MISTPGDVQQASSLELPDTKHCMVVLHPEHAPDDKAARPTRSRTEGVGDGLTFSSLVPGSVQARPSRYLRWALHGKSQASGASIDTDT